MVLVYYKIYHLILLEFPIVIYFVSFICKVTSFLSDYYDTLFFYICQLYCFFILKKCYYFGGGFMDKKKNIIILVVTSIIFILLLILFIVSINKGKRKLLMNLSLIMMLILNLLVKLLSIMK